MNKEALAIFDVSIREEYIKNIKFNSSFKFLKEVSKFTSTFIDTKKLNYSEAKGHQVIDPTWINCLKTFLLEEKYFGRESFIPWASFIAMSLGLNPNPRECWAIVWPAKIGVNVRGVSLEILKKSKLDSEREQIFFDEILRSNGTVFSVPDSAEFYLIKLEDQILTETFLPELKKIYTNPDCFHFDSNYSKWRKILNNIEMRWKQLGQDHPSSINSLWSWGWGQLPNSKGLYDQKSIKTNSPAPESEIRAFLFNGLKCWLYLVEAIELDITYNSNELKECESLDNTGKTVSKSKNLKFRYLNKCISFLKSANQKLVNYQNNHFYISKPNELAYYKAKKSSRVLGFPLPKSIRNLLLFLKDNPFDQGQ